jgi:hypothetical protein
VSVAVGDKVEFTGSGPWSQFVAAVVEVVDGGYIIGIKDSRKRVTPREIEPVAARKTVVTHPDGTQSTRSSVGYVYTHAVECREDMWAVAKLHRQEAFNKRAEKERFIAAVRAGRIAVRRDAKFFDSVYLLGEGGEEWWLGGDDHASKELDREASKLDRKAAVRKWLADADSLAARYDAEAGSAEAGPQYRYGVVRWSQSHANAAKGLREFEGRTSSTFRVVPAEAAE